MAAVILSAWNRIKKLAKIIAVAPYLPFYQKNEDSFVDFYLFTPCSSFAKLYIVDNLRELPWSPSNFKETARRYPATVSLTLS